MVLASESVLLQLSRDGGAGQGGGVCFCSPLPPCPALLETGGVSCAFPHDGIGVHKGQAGLPLLRVPRANSRCLLAVSRAAGAALFPERHAQMPSGTTRTLL